MNKIIQFFHLITFNFFQPDSLHPEQESSEDSKFSHSSNVYYGFEYMNGKHEGDAVLFIDTATTLFKSKPFKIGSRQIDFDEVNRDDRENLQTLDPNVEEWTYRRQVKKQLSYEKVSEILDAFAPY